MAAILNLPILDSAILHKKKLLSFILTQLDDGSHLEFCHLKFCHLGFSHFAKTLTQFNSIWLKLIPSHITWWWQPSWTLPSYIHPFCTTTLTQTKSIWLKIIHSHSAWWWQPSCIQPFCTKKNFTHSFWLNLMMVAILNSAILNSAKIGFTPFCKKKKNFTDSNLITICTKYFIHSIWSTWWWQPSWILPSWIQPFWTKLWLKLIQSDSNSFILTQLDDGSHLKFSHLGFSHLSFSSQTHPHLPRLVPTISKKKKNFTHSSLFTICTK